MRSRPLLLLVLLALFAAPAAAGANPLGDLLRVSELPANENGSAYDAQVEYNGANSEYLVSWTADGPFSPGDDEVFVQRLTASGVQVGADRQISTIGAEGDTTREPFGRPSIAADTVNGRNLVVWSSDELNDRFGGSEFSIFGQLLGPDGEEIGADDFQISGLQDGALYPDVAFNPGTAAAGDEEYLVVWTGEAKLAPVQWGQRLDENGTPIGSRFPISQAAESGTGSLPQVAYNALAGEYLVAWYSFKRDEDGEAWGQRVAADGTEIGDDVRLTTTGTDTDEIQGGFPSIAYNPFAGNYLMTWSRDERVDNPNPPPANTPVIEVFSQVLSATAVPQGTPTKLSAAGPLAYDSAVAYASSPGAGQYLVMWQQESPPPGIFDYEMWGRRIGADGTPLADAFPLVRLRGDVQSRGVLVAARTDALEWLSVWGSDCPSGPGIPAQDFEVMGRRVDAGATPSGDAVCRLPGTTPPDPDPDPGPGSAADAARGDPHAATGHRPGARADRAAEAQGRGRAAAAVHAPLRQPTQVPDPAADAEGRTDRARDGEGQRQAREDRARPPDHRPGRPAGPAQGPVPRQDRDQDGRRPQGHGDAPLPHLRAAAPELTPQPANTTLSASWSPAAANTS